MFLKFWRKPGKLLSEKHLPQLYLEITLRRKESLGFDVFSQRVAKFETRMFL